MNLLKKLPIICLIVLSLLLHSCIGNFQELGEKLENELILEIATDLLFNIAAIQIIDENSQVAPANITVELMSTDYSDVYTLLGSKTLEPREGLLLLGVRKTEKASADEGKMLSLKIEAPGYYPVIQNILSDTSTQSIIVPLRQLGNNMQIEQEVRNFRTNNGDIKIPVKNRDNLEINFDQNTQFFDDTGMEVTGNIIADITYYESSDDNKKLFDDILNNTQYLDQDGQLNPLLMNPLGIIDIDLTSGNSQITTLTFPSLIKMPITPGAMNPIDERPLRAGDFVPAFYWNEQEMAWMADGFAIIEDVKGQLVANLSVTHFTRWIIGFVNRSSISGNTEECHVFIRMLGDTPDTLRGSYTSNGQTINYEYTRRPEFRYYQIFPACLSGGDGFSLPALINTTRLRALQYFRNSNPFVFGDLKFDDLVVVGIQESIDYCEADGRDYFDVNLMANNNGNGTLRYNFGNFRGSRQVYVKAGSNSIRLPIPQGSLNNWLYGDGQFSFYYEDGCELKQVRRMVPLCDVPLGLEIAIENPSPTPPVMADVSISGTCTEAEGNFIVRPTLPVFYRPACDNESFFNLLGTIQDGRLMGQLPVSEGVIYDFKVQFGNEIYYYYDIEIPTDFAVYEFDGYAITLEMIEGVLNFQFNEIMLPNSVCDLIG